MEKDIKKNKRINEMRDLIFYSAFIAIPLGMFLVLNILINFNSILLAFQEITAEGTSFVGFKNFKTVITDFFTKIQYPIFFKNSLIVYGTGVLTTLASIVFSYYVYKKELFHNLIKIVLFLPTILSSIITISIYRVLCNTVFPLFIGDGTGLLDNPNSTAFVLLLAYKIFNGFGAGLLTNLAAMNVVDTSVSEAARLDGVGFFGELWHVVLPACYTVIFLSFITGIAGIFTDQFDLYAFFGQQLTNYDISTLGYYIYVLTLDAAKVNGAGTLGYGWLAAYGLIITVIIVPATLLLKKLIYKIGPSED